MRQGPRKVIDKEIQQDVDMINNQPTFKTLASCCGHGKYPKTIVVELLNTNERYEIYSKTKLKNKKKFYVRDEDGDYYIPEVSKPIKKKSLIFYS